MRIEIIKNYMFYTNNHTDEVNSYIESLKSKYRVLDIKHLLDKETLISIIHYELKEDNNDPL